MILSDIVSALCKIDGVDSICLSGSRAREANDGLSDYDIYVYGEKIISQKERTEALSEIGELSINPSFFEEGDELIAENEAPFDIMYRDWPFIEGEIDDVWTKHNARLGYTTCFISNVYSSIILYDKNSHLKELKERVSSPYPEELRRNIISKNLKIIDGDMSFPYLKQLENAVKRDDWVSVNHRVTAILASYFDVLFAYNRVLHPGEKKLIKIAERLNIRVPKDFKDDIYEVLSSTTNKENIIPSIKRLIGNLRDMVSTEL